VKIERLLVNGSVNFIHFGLQVRTLQIREEGKSRSIGYQPLSDP